MIPQNNHNEFGDFQTPMTLAERICAVVRDSGIPFRSVIEPTCGVGNFLIAAANGIPTVSNCFGLEINPAYADEARHRLAVTQTKTEKKVVCASYFDYDWTAQLQALPDPLLIVGNPPWVTNAELSSIGSRNIPAKSNFFRHRGLDARTGKSNFDISEWMLIQAVEWMAGRTATLAMLCKTSVARKVLLYAWKRGIPISSAHLYHVDADEHFSAAVDSCLLTLTVGAGQATLDCLTHDAIEAPVQGRFGFRRGKVVANSELYEKWQHLASDGSNTWRSGVKHDCAAVFELQREGMDYRNGAGELVQLEHDDVFPLLKSSSVANGRVDVCERWILMTQRHAGDDTSRLKVTSPLAWEYLNKHASLLDKRASSIYRNQHPYAMFGVGPYTFAPWKIAISGLYKRLTFQLVPPQDGKPKILDDTCYFIPFEREELARLTLDLLNSVAAREYFESLIFWDAKRPITADILRSLDIERVAHSVGQIDFNLPSYCAITATKSQLSLGGN